jgi:hypothetical protein
MPKGRRRPRNRFSEEVQQAILNDSLYHFRLHLPPPWDGDPGIQWTVRNLAKRYHISPSSVQRIWKKHGIQFAKCGRASRPRSPRGMGPFGFAV